MMSEDRSYEASVNALYGTQVHGDDLRKAYSERRATMEAMRVYLKRLEIDDAIANLPVLHVTGSKGKGSTCAFVEAILQKKSIHTVLFTSPHLVRVNERIRINGKPISNDLWTEHFWALWHKLQRSPGTGASEPPIIPGFFRLMTLMCFWVAVKENAQVLVLEVGVGGRFDATNVVPNPVACAITTLDLEHTDLLGPTLDDIAWEKGGIIKPGIPCFVCPQEKGGFGILQRCAEEVKAPFYLVEPLTKEQQPILGISGDFQRLNAALAIALVYTFLRRGSLSIQDLAKDENLHSGKGSDWLNVSKLLDQDVQIKEALEGCSWPGRCQRLSWGLSPDGKGDFYIDGAHTEQSMRVAVKWYDEQHQVGRPRALLFNCGEEKVVPNLLRYLIIDPANNLPRFDLVVFCPASSSRPTLSHSRSPRSILGLDEEEGHQQEEGREIKGKDKSQEESILFNRETLLALCNIVEGERREGKGDALDWQKNLCKTWRILQAYHLLDQAREKSLAEALQRVGEATRTVVVPSMDEALKELLSEKNRDHEILVTGSLYMVGNLLGKVEEGEKEEAKT